MRYEYEYEADSEVWTTKEGNQLYYFEMELEHLQNVKDMLDSKGIGSPYNLLKEINDRITGRK